MKCPHRLEAGNDLWNNMIFHWLKKKRKCCFTFPNFWGWQGGKLKHTNKASFIFLWDHVSDFFLYCKFVINSSSYLYLQQLPSRLGNEPAEEGAHDPLLPESIIRGPTLPHVNFNKLVFIENLWNPRFRGPKASSPSPVGGLAGSTRLPCCW